MFTRDFMLQVLANLIAGMIVVGIAYFFWTKDQSE